MSKSKYSPLIRKFLFGVTVLSFTTVAVFLSIYFLSDTERVVKSKIANLASNYYENYIYETLINSDTLHDLDETLKTYTETGLSSVYLRQLLAYGEKSDSATADLLRKHCDENKTSVKIFPEPPFTKTSYRTEYVYSCNFE